MRKTKLLDTLRALNTRERTWWREYVHSDFVNKHTALRALADYTLAHAPDFSADALDKCRVFAHLFGAETPFDEFKINNLVSDLYELLLRFLAYTVQDAEPIERQLAAADALLARNLDAQASGVLARCRLLLDRRPDQTARRQFLELRWWEATELLDSRRARRIASEHLYRQAEANDIAFVLEKLRLGAAMLSRHGLAVLQADERPRWLPAIRQWCVEEPMLAGLPAVQVYRAALDLLERPAADTFTTLTEALDAHYTLFGKDELAALYQYALNYCIRCINDGQNGAYPQALALYRAALNRDVLLRQGRLTQWTYKNITTTGLRSGAFDWTERFLHEYRDRLPPAERDNAFAYNLAALFFEKKAFDATLQTLQNVEFTDFTYHLGAKILQLKSYYLLGETEALHALLDAAKQLLRRNRSLSAFGKTANLNFLRLLRQVHVWKEGERRVSPDRQKTQRLALRNKALQTQPLANKEWLLEILEAE
jgi:hypothetical protein